MVLFELSPLFFINKQPYVHFFIGFSVLSAITVLQWLVNIYIFTKDDSFFNTRKRLSYVISYIIALLVTGVPAFIPIYGAKPEEPLPSPLYPFANALALNTIILIIIYSVKNRTKSEQKDRELTSLKIKHLEAEHQQLIQQLQPHFLFNALSTLKSLIYSNQEDAEEYVVGLSEFLRFSVSSHNKDLVLVKDELDFTLTYIKLQQLRFSDAFFYKLNIPEEFLYSYFIPIYGIQTLVENAIKHNAFSRQKPMYLTISFIKGKIVVKNNIVSKRTIKKGGVGLENLNKRFLLAGGKPLLIKNTDKHFSVNLTLISK